MKASYFVGCKESFSLSYKNSCIDVWILDSAANNRDRPRIGLLP